MILSEKYWIIFDEGGNYEEEFKGDIKEGIGRTAKEGGDKYRGEFKNNDKNNFEIIYMSSGDIYGGE